MYHAIAAIAKLGKIKLAKFRAALRITEEDGRLWERRRDCTERRRFIGLLREAAHSPSVCLQSAKDHTGEKNFSAH
jgi:hypothetical protein